MATADQVKDEAQAQAPEPTPTPASTSVPVPPVPPSPPSGSAAAAEPEDVNPYELVPGAAMLGRGMYLRKRQPYELRDYVIKRRFGGGQPTQVSSCDTKYIVPPDSAVNNSAPLPADRATAQTIIEESWNRFGREVTTSMHAAGSAKSISVDATAFQGSSLKAEEDAYYALRSAFIPFWNVYLPRADASNVSADFTRITQGKQQSGDIYLPKGPFDPAHRAEYARIFERFGTHYVRSVWLGGKATLAMVVTKSSNVSKEEVKAGLEAAFTGVASAGVSHTRTQTQERVRSNSTCNVFGCGGDATELAKLTSLQPEQYDKWIASVKRNPEIIEFSVAGIWTLIKDPDQSEALRQAYLEESGFTPLNAVVPFQDWLVFIKGDEVFDYALSSKYGAARMCSLAALFRAHEVLNAKALYTHLAPLLQEVSDPDLSVNFLEAAKRVLPRGYAVKAVTAEEVDKLTDAELQTLMAGTLNGLVLSDPESFEELLSPKLLAKVPAARLTAFKKRLTEKDDDLEGPLRNRAMLELLFASEVTKLPSRRTLTTYLPVLEKHPEFVNPHAAFSLGGFGKALNNKLYLFRWQHCLRVDLGTGEVDPGYPKRIVDEWPEVDYERIDAAAAFAPGRVYFFRGNEYIRYDHVDGRFVATARDLIKNRWPGVLFDSIDTAVYWGGNKIYFFSGDQYIRYDFATHRADPGYPKFLSSNYVEDWDLFR